MVRLISSLTGHHAADRRPGCLPPGWRNRGSLGRILNPVRAALLEASRGVPAESRAAVLRGIEADDLEPALVRTLDGVAREARRGPGGARARILWPVIGAVQLVIGAVFAFAVAWYVTLFLARRRHAGDHADVPYLGAVPLPLLMLARIARRERRARVAARSCTPDSSADAAAGEWPTRFVRPSPRSMTTAGTAGLDRLETIRARLADDLARMS